MLVPNIWKALGRPAVDVNRRNVRPSQKHQGNDEADGGEQQSAVEGGIKEATG